MTTRLAGPMVEVPTLARKAREKTPDQPDLRREVACRRHRPLHMRLQRLATLAQRAVQSPRAGDSPGLPAIPALLETLSEAFEALFEVECDVLLPLMAAGLAPQVRPLIRGVRLQHTEIEHLLLRLRILAGDYRVPEGAGPELRRLWGELASFEHHLLEYVRFGETVLLPRALSEEPCPCV